MKKKSLMKSAIMSASLILLNACTPTTDDDHVISISGKVQFPDDHFKMEIVQRHGFDRTVIDSCEVRPDGTYEFKMKVQEPGVYTLDYQKWQSVNFGAEDENLEIDFRGQDTAKI